MKIDAHQHYWDPARGDYGWMPKDNPTLYRRYQPADLQAHLTATGIDGTIVVQAAPTVAETEYLLDLAGQNASIKGVVGWIDFENPDDLDHLTRFATHPKFKGVRPMIQDIADPDWMLRDDIAWAYAAITELDLTFDALGLPPHLPNFATLFACHPDMRVVIDHCMKPAIRDAQAGQDTFTHWARGMTELATATGAYCKLSGLVTEAADGWNTDDLQPFVDHVLDAFGAERVMWGSDWPVCRLACDYEAWHNIAAALTDRLTADQKTAISGGTAARFYQIA